MCTMSIMKYIKKTLLAYDKPSGKVVLPFSTWMCLASKPDAQQSSVSFCIPTAISQQNKNLRKWKYHYGHTSNDGKIQSHKEAGHFFPNMLVLKAFSFIFFFMNSLVTMLEKVWMIDIKLEIWLQKFTLSS